jgi:integrase
VQAPQGAPNVTNDHEVVAMRGHVARKGNRYYAVVYEGFDPLTGSERHRWYVAGDTRKGAERVLGDLIKRMHDGDYRAPDRITLGDYLLERWLPTKQAQLRPSTFASYRNNVVTHVIPRIGTIPLQKLQPEDLDTFYAQLLREGRRNGEGGGLAPRTVRIIHGIIRKSLADAMRKGSVTRNVADLADPPKVRVGGSREMTVWSADELRDFLTSIEDSEWYVPIFLAANTGMRRGEVLGLTWRNVDLDAARLVVSQQILSVGYATSVAGVKTTNSRRTIDLDPRTVAVLKAWRRHQLEQKMSTGRRGDDEFVFTHPDGGPIHPDLFSQSWQRLMRDSEIRRIRLHDLRHTHATILLKAGVPVKVVSERLGHSSPAFTMTVYQHVLPGMQADAAAAFSTAVFGCESQ